MKIIRNDRRREYLIVDISPAELAILSTAANLIEDEIRQKGITTMPIVKETLEQVRAAFLAENTVKIL